MLHVSSLVTYNMSHVTPTLTKHKSQKLCHEQLFIEQLLTHASKWGFLPGSCRVKLIFLNSFLLPNPQSPRRFSPTARQLARDLSPSFLDWCSSNYIFISTSTPAGKFRLINESMVFSLGLIISINRL